jgi:hypothetical protein
MAHTWAWCQAMALTHRRRTFLLYVETGEGPFACPLAERQVGPYVDVMTPYGFGGFVGTGHVGQLAAAWADFVHERSYVCGYLLLNPLVDVQQAFPQSDVHETNAVYVLDLQAGLRALEQRLHTNRVRQLRQFRESADLVTDKGELLSFMLTHYEAFLGRRKAGQSTRLAPATLAALAASETVAMVGIRNQAALEAALLYAWTCDVGDYLLQVSVPGGERHSTVLIWHAVHDLLARRVPLLNLGGGIRPDDGVARFKERFGPRKLPLRSVKQVYRRDVYASLCRAAGEDPGDVTGYFPPYHRAR